jgi:hypothetical protein
MPDALLAVFAVTTVVLLAGTLYSISYGTYLDTSNPLLAHLLHPLHASHYFAAKSNPLNVYFIKRSWGWTSAVFLALWVTSPPSTRTARRLGKWFLETLAWMVFTMWFFGPAIIDRVTVASGGECILHVPAGQHISVPSEFCYTKSTISPQTHPSLFTDTTVPLVDFHAIPRLRRGHDVSGHIFLLTMSILFLADQIRASSRVREMWTTSHTVAVTAAWVLIVIWVFSCGTTGLYFHNPLEKLSGFCASALSFRYCHHIFDG